MGKFKISVDIWKKKDLRSYLWGAAFLVAIISIIFVILSTLKKLQVQKEESLKRELFRVLSTSENHVNLWKRDLSNYQDMIANFSIMRKLVEKGQISHESEPAIELLKAWSDKRSFHGYAIVKQEEQGNKYFILKKEQHGHELFKKAHATIDDALKGKFSLSKPLYTSKDDVISVSATPIRNTKGKIIGALAVQINLRNRFSEITNMGRMGNTGETYAFNENGKMLTTSRFSNRNQLNNEANLSRHPFFREMQKNTKTPQYFFNLKGYSDYRGVKVIGAWTWDEELNVGLITEIDAAEAYVSANIIQRAMWLMIVAVFIMMSLMLVIREMIARFRLKVMNQKEQTRKELMSIVSHDLKNPLNTLYVANQLLLKMISGEDPAFKKHRDLLEKSFKAANQMKKLISDLLDSSRIEAGKLELNFVKCDPKQVLKESIELYEAPASAKGITLSLNFPPDLPFIEADYERLMQIVSNILGNAIKYTPKEGRIEIAAIEESGTILFSISDTGPGITEEDQKHLFEAYWQSRRNKANFSTGLGLNIARDFIIAHGGKIWLESQVGKGTTFYFAIPIATKAPTA